MIKDTVGADKGRKEPEALLTVWSSEEMEERSCVAKRRTPLADP